jgi:Glycosyl transferase family 11.
MKIISKIYGGLGNQMFQYACGRAVANRLGARLYLDVSWFDSGNRVFLLNAFSNIKYFVFSKEKIIINKILRRIGINKNYINEPDYSYWAGIEKIHSSVILSGYWQNEKYFYDISEIIKQDFLFPEFDCLEAKNIAKKIMENTCSIGIHVRRGDYVDNPDTKNFHGICSLDYYKKALQIIVDKSNGKINPEIYFFSDDPDWIKNNFDNCEIPFIVVDINDHKDKPYHDMHLLSLCQHNIIANSSFSWWGAWLSYGKGIVVAPKRWFAEDAMKDHNPSLASWILI